MMRRRLAVLAALAALSSAKPAFAQGTPEAPPSSAKVQAPVPAAREFPSDDLPRAQRLAVAALQDLGFALERADATAGSLVASRLDAHPLRLAVSIRAVDEARISAEVVADFAGHPLHDARPAEAFFAAFEALLSPAPSF